MIANGTYTIRNVETDDYRTFMIRTQKEESKFAPGKRVVALLIGRDNTADFKPFAFVDDNALTVWRTKKGQGELTHYEIFGDMVRVLCCDLPSQFGKAYPGYEVMCEKTCRRCNRKLTTPESIRNGIGPECAQMAV